MLLKFAQYGAKNTGQTLMTHMGLGGLGAGATYGAISDNETIVSGAMKGGILGAGLGAGTKFLGAKYASGFNTRAKELTSHAGDMSQWKAKDLGKFMGANSIGQDIERGVLGNFNAGKLNSNWFGTASNFDEGVSSLVGFNTKFKNAYETNIGDTPFKELGDSIRAGRAYDATPGAYGTINYKGSTINREVSDQRYTSLKAKHSNMRDSFINSFNERLGGLS